MCWRAERLRAREKKDPPQLVAHWLWERVDARIGRDVKEKRKGGVRDETGRICFMTAWLHSHCTQPKKARIDFLYGHLSDKTYLTSPCRQRARKTTCKSIGDAPMHVELRTRHTDSEECRLRLGGLHGLCRQGRQLPRVLFPLLFRPVQRDTSSVLATCAICCWLHDVARQ